LRQERVPGGLPLSLDGAPRGDRGGAALHSAAVDAQGADEIQVEGNPRIALGLGEHPQHPLGRNRRRHHAGARCWVIVPPLGFHILAVIYDGFFSFVVSRSALRSFSGRSSAAGRRSGGRGFGSARVGASFLSFGAGRSAGAVGGAGRSMGCGRCVGRGRCVGCGRSSRVGRTGRSTGAGAGRAASGVGGARRAGCGSATLGGTDRGRGRPSRTGRSVGAGPAADGGTAGRTSIRGLTRAAGVRARSVAIVASSSGRPGRARSACSRAENGIGAGGGCRCATTSRIMTRAGGLRVSMIAGCPSTLRRTGATRAVAPTTLAWSRRSRATTIQPRFTGRDSTNVSCDTTVTASGWRRFR